MDDQSESLSPQYFKPAKEAPFSTPSSKPAATAASTTWEYLRDDLTRLPTLTNQQIDEVTPDTWAKAKSPRPNLRQHHPVNPSQASA